MKRHYVITYFAKLLLVLLISICWTFACCDDVFAVEGEQDDSNLLSFDMNIEYKGEMLNHNQDEIYYISEPVKISFPKGYELETDSNISLYTKEELEIVTSELEKVKSMFPGEDVILSVTEYRGKSDYDGKEFSDYYEVDKEDYTYTPSAEDIYNRQAVRFRIIRSFSFIINDEVKYVVNIKYNSKAYQFIMDSIAPEIKVISEGDLQKQMKVGSEVIFKVQDVTGIKNIFLYKNGGLSDSINLEADERIIEYDLSVVLSKNNDVDVLKVVAEDLAGNISEFSFEYKIDNLEPMLNISGSDKSIYGGNNTLDGVIFGDKVTVSLTALDNSGRTLLFYKCLYTDENGNSECIENATSEIIGNDSIYREYDREGIYDIVAFAYDESGNYTDTYKWSFGIDMGVPEVLFANVENHKTYNGPVSVYATLGELFFEKTSAEISGTIADSAGERQIVMAPFIIGGRLNRNVYTFAKDGVYKLTLRARDNFGRDSVCSVGFSIDTAAPEIKLSLLDGKKPVVQVNAVDELSEFSAISILYRKDTTGLFTEVRNDNVVSVGKNAEFSVAAVEEGEYLFKIYVKDSIGNTSEDELAFVVDKTPPVIGYIDEFNEKYLKRFVLPKNLKEYIEDTSDVRYSAYLNSKEIDSCDVKKDGKYVLQVVAEDEAGNNCEKMIAFIIDNTLPKIIVHGIESGGRVKKDDVVKLTLFDEDDFFKNITVNGKKMDITNNREIDVQADAYGDYDISVVASDFAGNEITEVVKMNCAYSENPFIHNIDMSDIKTLTKNEPQIRESFWEKKRVLELAIISGIIVATAVIFGVFTFVDRVRNKG